MVHRGPDDEHAVLDRASGTGLGCRRLSIIDVEGGRQPIANEDGTVWAALNGELYNYRRLRESLLAEGHAFSSGTDTEVLVHLYERYGASMVHSLEGMFAFAVLDRARGRLLLARDRFGEKPLFYQERGGILTFASELTALVAGIGHAGEIDPRVVDDFFIHGYVPGPSAMLEGVWQLPPAHTLVWDLRTARSRIERYWTPVASAADNDEPRGELVDELHRLLSKAVRSTMISDVPLGVSLSGGVDSSLIAALAASASPDRNVEAFTVGYDVIGRSEVKSAEAAARVLGLRHHVLTLTRGDIAPRVRRVLGALDQPLADQALVPLQALSEFARERVKVLVGGEGADELFGGYPRYRWLARAAGVTRRIPTDAAALTARALKGIERGERSRRIVDVVKPQGTIERHLGWVTDRRSEARRALYGPRLHHLAEDRGFIGRTWEMLDAACTDPGPADMMTLDQRGWLPDDVLAKADRAGMLASVEIRTPYLQREVAEFAASVPVSAHLHGRGKSLLRSLLKRVAPRMDYRRSKAAFRAPADDWLRGPLVSLMGEQLEGGHLFREEWFSAERTRKLLEEHVAGTADRAGLLWPVLCLGVWLDGFRLRQTEVGA